uniref:Uncharacterized protein n=1 Tax=Populus trichocarpa TaxID=3694 RepID=A0A2K2BQ08_POPTR
MMTFVFKYLKHRAFNLEHTYMFYIQHLGFKAFCHDMCLACVGALLFLAILTLQPSWFSTFLSLFGLA